MSKVNLGSLDEEKEGAGKGEDLRIDALGNKIKVENLFEESDYYEDYTAKSASDQINLGPKPTKKHIENLRRERTDIEKIYAGDIGLYRRTYCPTVCKMKSEAEKKCDEEDDRDACRDEKIYSEITDDLNCGCGGSDPA